MKYFYTFLTCLFCLSVLGQPIKPSDYLASLPKYPFNTNSQLPKMTSFGFYSSIGDFEYASTWKELADEFSYAIPLGYYADDATVHNALTNAFSGGSASGYLIWLVSNNPSFYKLGVAMDRTYTNPPTGFYVTNSAGQFTDGSNVWTGASSFVAPMSFECPSNYLAATAQRWANLLLLLTNVCPVTYVEHGGEDGISLPFRFTPTTGAGKNVMDAQRKDPRVQAATNTYPSGGANLGPWLTDYYNDRTKFNLSIVNKAITNAFPNLKGWFYFAGIAEEFRDASPGWLLGNALFANASATAPYFNQGGGINTYYEPQSQYYYTNHANNALIYGGPTASLFEQYNNGLYALYLLGKSNSFTWFTAGYSDSDLTRLGNIDIQAGLMKCETINGSISFSMGGFDAEGINCSGTPLTNRYQAFATNCPPHWLLQLAQAGYVKNFFSHYDTYLTNGIVLSDHNSIMSSDRPSLWLTNTAAITNLIITCRNINSNLWIACAWASDGITNVATANIPNGPTVILDAIGRGNTYLITSNTVVQIDAGIPYYIGNGVWMTNDTAWTGWISQNGTPDGATNSISWFNAHSVTNTFVYFTGDFTTALEMNWPGTTNDTLQYDMTRARWINDSWPGGAIQCHGYGDVHFIGAQVYATNNGSGRAFTNECIGFDLINAYGVTMDSCTVTGMYVRVAGSREFSPGTLFGVDTDCVRSTFGVQDLTITNCYLSDAEVLISIKNWSFGFYFSGFNIRSNQLYRSCISLSINSAFASLTGAFMENVFIRNNIFDHQTPWSAPPENSSYGLHLNYIFPFFANNGGDYNGYGSVITNVWIEGNYFGPDVCGTNFNTSLAIQTQWGVTNITITDWHVDNNVFVWTNTITPSAVWNNGFVILTGTTNLYVANNDFISVAALDSNTGLVDGRNKVTVLESDPVVFVNNLTIDCALQVDFNGGGTGTNYSAGTWSDYNVFMRPWTLYTAGNLGQYDCFGPAPGFPNGGLGHGFWEWTNTLFTVGTSTAYFDRHSTTNDAIINADYTPKTNSILLNAGTNLTSRGITTDYLGHGRPVTGNWTIGAFQLTTGGGVTNPVACFTGTPTTGFSPLLVTFTDCSQNANTWSWDFGDSGTSTSQNPTHTYTVPGTYTVTETVTGFGATNSLTRINYIFVDQHVTVTNFFQGRFQF